MRNYRGGRAANDSNINRPRQPTNWVAQARSSEVEVEPTHEEVVESLSDGLLACQKWVKHRRRQSWRMCESSCQVQEGGFESHGA